MPELLAALILGIVEGLTEFIPVSSSGHMIIAGHLLGFTGTTAEIFEVVIQLGPILAVVMVFYKRLFGLIGIHFGERPTYKPRLNLLHIILGGIPAIVLGLLVHAKIKALLFGPKTVVYALIAGGVLLILAEIFKPKKPKAETVDNISYKQAFGIGLFQCLALWPGFSRSGSTISGALLLGVSRKAAVEYSFLLSVPMMIGATGFDLVKNASLLTAEDWPIFIIGFVVSFLVSVPTIKFFLNIIQRTSFVPFAVYRFILAAIVYIVVLY